jgi:hypothetical protein
MSEYIPLLYIQKFNYARWPQQLKADFHEGRDFRKNIQINITIDYTTIQKQREKELLYKQQYEPILSVCLINISSKRFRYF